MTWREHRRGTRIVEPPHAVNVNAGRIDHGPRFYLERLTALGVLCDHARNPAAFLDKPRNRRIVERGSTQVNDRLRQGHRHAGVVELTVGVKNAAVQALGADRGDFLDDFIPAYPMRSSDSGSAREQVVEFQSDPIEGQIEPAIGRNNKVAGVYQVRSVPQEHAALLERLAYQGDVSLGQVAHSTVNQLGAAARGSVGEVAGFEEQRPIAPRRGVERPPPGPWPRRR